MPLYEYACKRCGNRFEVRQKFSDEPVKTHEECGGDAERVLSVPAFQFKGTGWYVTDYAKSGAGNPRRTAHGKEIGSQGRQIGRQGRIQVGIEIRVEIRIEIRIEARAKDRN